MKDRQDVVKSNALIEAVHSPSSVYQMRLFIAALMQVKAKEEIDFSQRYYVKASDLAELTKNKKGDNYPELRKAADELINTTVTVRHTPTGERLRNREKINLVSSCVYHDNEGFVGLRFTPEITPYISELRNRFTVYEAKHVLPMRSSYGVRLYELCKQWLGSERVFTVDEFKELLGITEQYSTRIDHLKARVVTPALSDINTHSDLEVAFSQRKRGRVVSHFVFTIAKKKAAQGQATAAVEALSFEDWVNRYQLAKDRGFEDWKAARKTLGGRYRTYKKDPQKWVEKNCA